jgi:hypothetical protein
MKARSNMKNVGRSGARTRLVRGVVAATTLAGWPQVHGAVAASPAKEFVMLSEGVTLVLDEPAARQAVAAQLVLLGRDADDAAQAAACLAAADIEVLLGNPNMMQVGGGDGTWLAILAGVLLIAGLIVVAASSNGSVMISV